MTLCVALFSCSNEDSIKNEKESELFNTHLAAKGLCPPGSTEVWEYEFDGFRFKRPKFDCGSGFFFCTVKGNWSFVGCRDQFGTVYPATPSLSPVGTKVIAFTNNTVNEVTILFPYGLVNKPGNNVNDFNIFSVDEEINIGNMKLKAGAYPTTFTATEIVVKVPIY